MRMPAGIECAYYYEDYYRGSETQECRLVSRNSRTMPWEPALCRQCPVPSIMAANSCSQMMLEAEVVRRLYFWKRIIVEVFCSKTYQLVEDPYVGCGRCHEDRHAADIFGLDVAPDRDDPPLT